MTETSTRPRTAAAGMGLKKARKSVPPTKTTLNLAIREKKELSPSRVIPGVLAVLVAAALFSKFAVSDRFARAAAAEADVAQRRARLAAIQESYADFDEVRAQYNRYTYTGYDRTIADRLDVLDLLEREVFPVCSVRSLNIGGKSVALSVSGLTLEQISDLIARLEADPLVAGVTVSTASYNADYDAFGSTEGPVEPVANMTVSLADAGQPAAGTAIEMQEGGAAQ